MKLTPDEIAIELSAIESMVPVMRVDPATFLQVFELLSEKLVARVSPDDRTQVRNALQRILARTEGAGSIALSDASETP